MKNNQLSFEAVVVVKTVKNKKNLILSVCLVDDVEITYEVDC